jgi:plasmid stabilization system protein ParE
MAFQVVFGRRAQSDIATAVAWLADTRPASAARWHTGLLRIVETLETDPNRCAVADEAADLGVDLRQLLYGRRPHVYRILFTIDGETVNVLRVRHAAQDLLSSTDI